MIANFANGDARTALGTLDKHRLRERAGRVGAEEMRKVDAALGVSFGLRSNM